MSKRNTTTDRMANMTKQINRALAASDIAAGTTMKYVGSRDGDRCMAFRGYETDGEVNTEVEWGQPLDGTVRVVVLRRNAAGGISAQHNPPDLAAFEREAERAFWTGYGLMPPYARWRCVECDREVKGAGRRCQRCARVARHGNKKAGSHGTAE